MNGCSLAVAGDHVHLLGGDALEALDLLGVRAHLEEGGGLHPAGELGVGDLVGPGAEVRARALDLQEEVGVAAPATVEEGGLVDDVGAGLHGGEGLGLGVVELGDGVAGHGDRRRPVLPSLRGRSTCAVSCSPPRRDKTSSIGSSRLGRSRSPRAADSSSWVRCSHAEKPVRSLALSASVPSSRRCMSPYPARIRVSALSLSGLAATPCRQSSSQLSSQLRSQLKKEEVCILRA